jgi:hypothetical protein
MLLPHKQVIDFEQLRSEGLKIKEIKSMYSKLKIFPTPFKGIYYIPSEEEHAGSFIERPMRIVSKSIEYFLNSEEFYFSCMTAEEAYGIDWHMSGEVHIVNLKLSRVIDLKERISRNKMKGNWRSKKLATLLSFYGRVLIFHKVENISRVKTKLTRYGRFATKSQIKKDKKRFRER